MAGTELQSQLEHGLDLRQRKRFRRARKIFEELACCDDASVAARAQIELGKLEKRGTGILTRRADTEAAIASYEKAAAAGDPELSPQAAVLLGELLRQSDRPAEAEKAFVQAIDSGHPEWFPDAAMKLAGMVCNDVPDRAVSLYERVLETGPALAGEAAYRLGEIYRGRGDVQRAREYYARSAGIGGTWSSASGAWYLRLPGPRGNPDAVLQGVVAEIRSKASGIPSALSDEDRERLRATGETLLVDALLVTANSNKQVLPVILTDRRTQVGGFASDYTTLQMSRQYQGHSKTRTNMGSYTKTTTRYAFSAYTLLNAQSQKTVLQLGEQHQHNMALARTIDEVTRCFIEPAQAAGVVDLVRSGDKSWRIRRTVGSDTTVLLSITRDGVVVPIGGQPRQFAWAELRCPALVKRGAFHCRVLLADGQGSTIESDDIAYNAIDLLELVLSYCQYELS